MQSYRGLFKMTFKGELQYRAKALSGITTQFFWGLLYIYLYTAFMKGDTIDGFSISQMCSFIWLGQAFFVLRYIDLPKKCAKEIYDGLVKLNEDLKTMPLIRFMEEKDIDGVAEVEKECFANPWSEQSLKEELENGNARFFVCETKGEIAGYIGTISVFGECSVTNVAVKEKFRNKGIARALLERAILNSTLADDEFITLEVRKSNIPAISLYEKYGFVKMGERKNFYRSPTEDAFIYNKYLKGENK